MQHPEKASKGRVLMVLITSGNCLRIRHMKKVVERVADLLSHIDYMHIEISDRAHGFEGHCLQIWVNGTHVASTERGWRTATEILKWLEVEMNKAIPD